MSLLTPKIFTIKCISSGSFDIIFEALKRNTIRILISVSLATYDIE